MQLDACLYPLSLSAKAVRDDLTVQDEETTVRPGDAKRGVERSGWKGTKGTSVHRDAPLSLRSTYPERSYSAT